MITTTHSPARTLIALMTAVLMMLALSPAAPAQASTTPLLATVVGHADLPSGLSACNVKGDFEGTAVGVHGGAAFNSTASATQFTYCNDVITGTANGVLVVDGHSCDFAWARFGASALVTFGGGCTGAAVAAFVPDADQAGATLTAQGSIG
jgi:hypothetical protein